jgi:signal transduction histidine kinase
MLHRRLHISSRALMGLGLGLVVWLVLGSLDAAETYVKLSAAEMPRPWNRALGQGLLLWLAWGILAIPISLLVRYYPFEQRRWLSSIAVYLVAGAVGAVLKMAMDYPIIEAWAVYRPPGQVTFSAFMRSALIGYSLRYLLIFWAIAGICHARNYYLQSREREHKALVLESRLAQAQIEFLRAQLQPHFLFNTLNAISTLIHRDTDVADRMLARLGHLLRLTLDNAGTPEITLRQELEFIRAYLEIEQIRFGSRLHVTIDVDPDVLELPVPSLVLQPIVENAVKHGIAPQDKPGNINITAQRVDDCLRLEVCDDGPGLCHKLAGRRNGIGLANTRARLEQLYGVDYRLRLAQREEGGVIATVDLPIADAGVFRSESRLLEPQISDVP